MRRVQPALRAAPTKLVYPIWRLSTGVTELHVRAATARTVWVTHRVVWRIAVVTACAVTAYHYSLSTLLQQVGQDTPLAYLGMVPILGLILAIALAQPKANEVDVHDRYFDYILGLPLLVLAMGILVVLPSSLSSLYWLHRLDLLSMPLFVAGAIAITFGARALWRLRAAILFLLLAWPWPYVVFLDHQLNWFTDTTASAVTAALKVVPVATRLTDGDFLVQHVSGASHDFLISVNSACSGINGGLGFLLVGGAAAILMRGRWPLRLLWLAVGTSLLFAINVLRIVLILGAGHVWGEHVAIDVLHPAVGLVMILAATVVMLLLLPRFHLSLDLPTLQPQRVRAVIRQPLAVRRARTPLLIVALTSLIAAAANANMSKFELLAFGFGPPKLGPQSLASAPIGGWSLTHSAEYDWATRYFGNQGTWDRYVYVQTVPTSGQSAPPSVTLDLIDTSDLSTFSAFGIEACYQFHNFDLMQESQVDLGGGLHGSLVRYRVPRGHGTWLALYWEWPVRVPGSERYQRVVLSVDSSVTQNQLDARTLSGFAREMVNEAADHVPTPPAGEF